MSAIVADKKKKQKDKKNKSKKKKDLLAKLAAQAEQLNIEEQEEIDAEAAEKEAKKLAKKKAREARLAKLKQEQEGGPVSIVPEEPEEDDEETKKRKEILARAKAKREKEEAEARKAKRGDKSVRTTIAEETLLDDVEKDQATLSEDDDDENSKKKKKKLSNKERKRLKREAELAAIDKQLASSVNFPFSCSHVKQAITDRDAWKRSTDINIEEFTVAGTGKKGTNLFVEASLRIVSGRRYGLVGPNGMGKTTLLRLLGKKLLPIPPLIDMLIVEQEIEGTNMSAIDAVLAADKKRTRLLETEANLLKQLDEMQDDVDPTKIIEDLKQVTSDLSSTARQMRSQKRKILSGLGF